MHRRRRLSNLLQLLRGPAQLMLMASLTTTGATTFALSSAHASPWVVGGEPSKVCGWPTAVTIGSCSASLIHPRVIITAAHCIKGNQPTVMFGESITSATRRVATDFCVKNPEFGGMDDMVEGSDYGFCYLKEAVTDVPVVPIIYGCERDQLWNGKQVWLAGFGVNENEEGLPQMGVKYEVETELVEIVTKGRHYAIGGNGKSGCFADSGGPAYVQLSDGSWRTFGITSGGHPPCGGITYYVDAAQAVPFIQENLKKNGVDDVDVTPCYKDDGSWDPSSACTELPLDPQAGEGSWENGCREGASLSGPSKICAPGHPKVSPPKIKDNTPPFVQTVQPYKGQSFGAGAKIDFLLETKDVSQIASVILKVGDKQWHQGRDEKGPGLYAWKLVIDGGSHEVTYTVTDKAGNSATTEPVTITVTGEDKGDPGEDPDSFPKNPKNPGDGSPDESESTTGSSPDPEDTSSSTGSTPDPEGTSSTTGSTPSPDDDKDNPDDDTDTPKDPDEDEEPAPGDDGILPGICAVAPRNGSGLVPLFALLLLRRWSRNRASY